MHLPLRLRTIGDLISSGEKVADIGADHGILELYLVGKIPDIQIVAIENKEGPYENLKQTLSGLKGVRLSLSDGLTSVDKKVTTIVLAGMGGLNIKKILDEAPQKLQHIDKIIIDAHRDKDIARKTIVNYGFKIEKEIIVFEENKFYIISEFVKTKKVPHYSKDVLEIGYKLYKDDLWQSYKKHLINNNKNLIGRIKNEPNTQDKVLKLLKMIERIGKYGKN